MASGKAESIDKMTMKELAETMEALGVSDEGAETLSDARSRIKTWLNEAQKTSNWSPGKAFSVLSEAKEEDARKRQHLLDFYTEAEAFVGRMDERMITLLQKHTDHVKEDIQMRIKQLEKTEYFLLVAGK